ncbi:MAG: hypothetical protein GXP11_02925 [Gammaproteobacteria bacterium]|nr:hypothetical protein [Gammaproteobacteria bacterium]
MAAKSCVVSLCSAMPGFRISARSRDYKRLGALVSQPFFCARHFYFALLLLFGSTSLFTASAADTSSVQRPPPPISSIQRTNNDEIARLIDAGIWHLALKVLEQQQQAIAADPERWVAQEKLRIRIYQATADWPDLITRLQNLPAIVPLDFYLQAHTDLAAALIKMNQGRAALAILRELIWTQALDPDVAKANLLNWRRMVIDAYRVSGQKRDAYRAAARLQHDYGNQDLRDVIRYAKILLELGRHGEAVDRLASRAQQPQVAMLYLLAQLRSGARTPQDIVHAGLQQLRKPELRPNLKAGFWALVAEAAQTSHDPGTRANALEHVLGVEKKDRPEKSLFDFNADTLWNAYLDFAIAVGNQSHFLIGEDEQWQQAAQRATQKQPVRSRALYVLLMLKGQAKASRDAAVKDFLHSLSQGPQGKRLLRRLFLNSRRFNSYQAIPAAARYVLADIALAVPDIELASALMATVKKPPPGADQFFWYLRRARILILGGKGEQGAEALEEMLQQNQHFESAQLDHLMQVIFDLQAAGLQVQAYALLRKVMNLTDDHKLQREIYYWMADSKKAQQEFAEAARLYLKSAMFIGAKAMDPWAQTARYQAAVALGKAGLLDDARTIYRHLLRVTKDSARKAVLQRELQKLRFKD